MRKAAVASIGALLIAIGGSQHGVLSSSATVVAAQLRPSAPARAEHARRTLDQYCVTCHNAARPAAQLALDTIDVDTIAERAEVWEKVVRKLRARAMPPAGAPRPDETTYDDLAASLEAALDRAAAGRPNPGRPLIHRLNRAEYANAIRDLLALEVDVRSLLPADDAGYGFDNIADVLSVSPGLLDRYLSAATAISRAAVGDPALRPTVETYTLPPFPDEDDRASDDLPFGTRGGLAVRHYFPLDGEYVLSVRLQRVSDEMIRGLAEPHQLDVRVDAALVARFTIGGQSTIDPAAGSPRKQKTADQRDYERTADAGLTVRVAVKAGTRLVGVAFLKRPWEREGMRRPRLPVTSYSFATCGSNWTTPECEVPAIESVQIAGPFDAVAPEDTPARRKLFVCRPRRAEDEPGCARRIVSALARRAYRGVVTGADVDALVGLFNAARADDGFDAAIAQALRAVLVSPHFLFRVERDPDGVPGTPYRLAARELASRLSFFLWSSVPDEDLLRLAEHGRLTDPAVLEQQVRRMLADSRSSALVGNFAAQWLYLRNMRTAAPDANAFPDFDDGLRDAFQRETGLFLESQLRDDRPVVELLTANYTFVNERLARHYGIGDVYGSHFRRVTFGDGRRGGLLGQGSILTVTSYGNRTAPTIRGKWVLENILGSPPPPPPPNVPDLKEAGENGRPASVRERMEQHRKNPVCASCHARMDPLGFALENFDAIGKWRTTSEAGTPIDASGTLPDGTRFDGPADLRALLAARGTEFVTTVTEKLLTYALGRGLEWYDAPAVRAIVREAGGSGARWSSLVLGIARSTPFLMRNRELPAAERRAEARR